MDNSKVLAQFLGDESFPVEWKDEKEKGLFWWFDDNHCPFPISPMYFSLDGWWGPTCEYLFRRFDIPSGVTWEAKRVNGYVYTAIESRDAKDAEESGKYYDWIMPTYAENFLNWWENRYLPETLNNFKYVDTFDAENATIQELMIHLEEMIDIQERHFRLHWVLNWAQFAASMTFNSVVNSLIGNVDQDLLGKVNVSRKDRNWDSLKALWQLKEEIRKDSDLNKIFNDNEDPADIEAVLQKSEKGKAFLNDVFEYAKEFGYKAVYTHEYVFPLYVEDQKPILEQLRSYLISNFDYNEVYDKCIAEQDRAIAYLREQIKDRTEEEKKEFEHALALNLAMLPLTPDHHFYFDQGTYARMRIVLLRVARKLVEMGLLDDPEDIMFLEYEQLRRYVADPENYDGRKIIADAKAYNEKAKQITPRDWIGTVTQQNMYEEPYHTLWGYPEKFERESQVKVKGEVQGLPASPGVVEGIARVVKSPAEFNEVKQGDIMVCIMTNPAWVVVFSKIAGIVTDSGGVLSHSAVVAREFMMPAVVGTGTATREIKSGDKIRVDGDKGVVTILA
jgi:pyruvate,water dikinase